MKVKGTWITDYVKMIKANKDKDWDKYLEPSDWEIINSKVLPSGWYPYETFMRTGKAVFFEIAQKNFEVTRAFGKIMGEQLAGIYRNVVVPGDPAATIAKIYALQGTFFRDIPSLIGPTIHEKNRTVAKIIITPREREIGAPKGFAYQFLGILEQLIEKAGIKEYKSEVRDVEDGYEVDISWK